jgi:predicted nucleic acid-binding protein
MKYLVDTSVWLKALLGQQRADEATRFLQAGGLADLGITDFALFSICLQLLRHGKPAVLDRFIRDVKDAATIVRLSPEKVADVLVTMRDESLDFDDAYQYVATLVSFDKHFVGTGRGFRRPSEILADEGK